jgi:hypothetical protein
MAVPKMHWQGRIAMSPLSLQGSGIMRRPLTTFFGITAICFGVLGTMWMFLSLAAVLSTRSHAQFQLMLIDRVLALGTKWALCLTGIFLLMRSRVVVPALVVTLMASTVDSLLVYGFLMGPIPEGLSSAGYAGRIVGHLVALVLPPIMYLALLFYLTRPKTREEFATDPDAWRQTA